MGCEKLLVARRRAQWRREPFEAGDGDESGTSGQGGGWRGSGRAPLTQVRVPMLPLHGHQQDEQAMIQDNFKNRGSLPQVKQRALLGAPGGRLDLRGAVLEGVAAKRAQYHDPR